MKVSNPEIVILSFNDQIEEYEGADADEGQEANDTEYKGVLIG